MTRLLRALAMHAALVAVGVIPVFFPTLLDLDDPLLRRALGLAPWVLFVAIGLLGFKINQSKVAIGCATFALAFAIADGSGVLGLPLGHTRERMLATISTVPIIVTFLGLKPEQRFWSAETIVRAFMSILAPAFATRLAIHGFGPEATLSSHVPGLDIPELLLVPTLILIVITSILSDPHVRSFQSGQATSLVVIVVGAERVLSGAPHEVLAIAFSSAALIQLIAMLSVWWRKVYIDELTEVPNRRALNEYLHTLGDKFTIAMVDIDFFKKFNDTYGHAEGDNVLRYVARHLAENASGRVFRYGGEEFCLVYRNKKSNDVFQTVDEMRDSLAKRSFVVRSPEPKRRTKKDRGKNASDKKLSVTISVGMASRGKQKTPDGVMEIADKMLYRAKEQGRNQVIAA